MSSDLMNVNTCSCPKNKANYQCSHDQAVKPVSNYEPVRFRTITVWNQYLSVWLVQGDTQTRKNAGKDHYSERRLRTGLLKAAFRDS